jgi:hypothetical protein
MRLETVLRAAKGPNGEGCEPVESGSGEIRNVDYDPLSLAVGLSYKF